MNLPQTAPDQLAMFRATYAPQTVTIQQHEWQLLVGGTGDTTLLILPGARGKAEESFRLMQLFAPQYQVVSLSYPTTITTMGEMLEGLTAVIQHLSPQHPIHLLGGSYGGLLAQALVRHIPEHIQTLILNHTGIPQPERAQKDKRFSILIRLLPYRMVQTLFQKQVEQILPILLEDRTFWHTYLTDTLNSISKKALLNRVKVSIDLDTHTQFTPNDLTQWQGEVLIIEGEDDPMLTSYEQQQLRKLYPQATCHRFDKTGHITALIQPDIYATHIHQFLRQA